MWYMGYTGFIQQACDKQHVRANVQESMATEKAILEVQYHHLARERRASGSTQPACHESFLPLTVPIRLEIEALVAP